MRHSSLMLAAALALAAQSALAVKPVYADTTLIPQRAIIVTGEMPAGHDQVAILYSREDLSFNEPSAPRFLFLDRQGKVAFGIGGNVKLTGMYDMNGAIDGNGFETYDIPTPINPAQRQRLGADASHSSIFLKLAARTEKVGQITVYIQTNFTGDNGGYGMKLKQAYVTAGHWTAGKARSTFADGESQAPTVDSEGPSGQIDAKNLLIRYKSPSYRGFSFAASVEMPSADYTLAPQTEDISQRFPDIPVYLQYAWDGGDSHIRLAGLLRELSYRDLATADNHFVTGWGVHLSTVATVCGPLGFFGHAAYGRGIAEYINDLSGNGFDLVADGTGRLRAPRNLAWGAGLTLQPRKNLLLTASYSQARDLDRYTMAADTYRYAQYLNLSCFYTIASDLQIGAEYVWGRRSDFNHLSGHANRLEASLQYSF